MPFFKTPSRSDQPESAAEWSAAIWRNWLTRAVRVYFGPGNTARRRAAFMPFAVEPISDVHPADQLQIEVAHYCPEAEDMLAAAVEEQLGRWRMGDGVTSASFLLHLYDLLGVYGDAADREDVLLTFISRIGPGSEEDTSRLARDVAETAVGRCDAVALRRLCAGLQRRSAIFLGQPWLAQIRLLEGLLIRDGIDSLYADVAMAVPGLRSLVTGNRVAKHLLADAIVDSLGLPGIAKILECKSEDPAEAEILSAIYFCVVGSRLEYYKDNMLIDILHGTCFRLPPRERSTSMMSARSQFLKAAND